MRNPVRIILALAVLAAPALAGSPLPTIESLGEALFHDPNLSLNRSQSCATCHDPDHAFVDPRETEAGWAVSLGDDGHSLGDRSAPTIGYAAFVPDFHLSAEGRYTGGLFWDGRAATLEDQAGGPPLNPVEMAMPDKASVVARLQENPDYVAAMRGVFHEDVFTDTDRAFAAMTRAIAAFERTPAFAPFDSRYDRFLRGEITLTPEEELGRQLFFSTSATNCNRCHQIGDSPSDRREIFSNHRYHNIGVPKNDRVRALNGLGPYAVDKGLMQNPAVDDPKHKGKHRVPTLRNVAVTGPYMHNGVFEDLRTVVFFYNKYNTLAKDRQINPETGRSWRPPEVARTLSVTDLIHGPALDDRQIDALVAFMTALTDARYEHLLGE